MNIDKHPMQRIKHDYFYYIPENDEIIFVHMDGEDLTVQYNGHYEDMLRHIDNAVELGEI